MDIEWKRTREKETNTTTKPVSGWFLLFEVRTYSKSLLSHITEVKRKRKRRGKKITAIVYRLLWYVYLPNRIAFSCEHKTWPIFDTNIELQLLRISRCSRVISPTSVKISVKFMKTLFSMLAWRKKCDWCWTIDVIPTSRYMASADHHQYHRNWVWSWFDVCNKKIDRSENVLCCFLCLFLSREVVDTMSYDFIGCLPRTVKSYKLQLIDLLSLSLLDLSLQTNQRKEHHPD